MRVIPHPFLCFNPHQFRRAGVNVTPEYITPAQSRATAGTSLRFLSHNTRASSARTFR